MHRPTRPKAVRTVGRIVKLLGGGGLVTLIVVGLRRRVRGDRRQLRVHRDRADRVRPPGEHRGTWCSHCSRCSPLWRSWHDPQGVAADDLRCRRASLPSSPTADHRDRAPRPPGRPARRTTVLHGIEGFGRHAKIHTSPVFNATAPSGRRGQADSSWCAGAGRCARGGRRRHGLTVPGLPRLGGLCRHRTGRGSAEREVFLSHPAVFVVGPVVSAGACAGLVVASSSVLPRWTVTSGRTPSRWQAGQEGGQCRWWPGGMGW